MRYSHSASILVLAFVGFLFSGYLSATKFFTATCALSETCPLFLGYPACYFGFGLFVALVLCTALLYSGGALPRLGHLGVAMLSLLGTLFAGYYTLGELPVLVQSGFGAYVLGLPTCAFGFVVFVAILILALTAKRQ